MRIKIIFLMAFLILALVLLISCGGASGPDDKNGAPTGDSKENQNQDQNADNARENTPDFLPDGLNFNGVSIRILHRDDTEIWRDEISVEEEIGEIVTDALYRRNRKVEERLNIKITPVPIAGTWDSRDSFLRTVRNSVNAGADDYDLIAGYAYYITALAPEGMLFNLNDLEYLSPNADWWSADLAEQLNVGGKFYYITGDYALTFLQTMFVMFFNKTIARDLSLPNLYQIVLDGGFTLDKMEELTKSVYRDLNGDGLRDAGDMYGLALTTGNFIDAMFNTFDLPIIKKDADGVHRIVMNSPKMISAVERIYGYLYESGDVFSMDERDSDAGGGVIVNMFSENKTLFMPGSLGSNEQLRAMDSDYGIIPYPKFDLSQAAYYTTSQDSYSLFCVPATCGQTPAAGAAIEALCAESYRTVTPAYYEIALKQKYSRDDETSQMLDLIRAGATFDFGTVNSYSLDNINKIFRNLISEKSKDFASRYERSERAWQRSLDKLLDAYQDLP